MSFNESVDEVLRKVAYHNSDVFGCIAAYDDKIYSTLPEVYDLIDVEAVVEYATNLFVLSGMLDSEEEEFKEIFVEFQGHSFIVRKMRAGTLILATRPLKRGTIRKMQLGLNLFLKPLERALRNAAGEEQLIQPQNLRRGTRGLRRVLGNIV